MEKNYFLIVMYSAPVIRVCGFRKPRLPIGFHAIKERRETEK